MNIKTLVFALLLSGLAFASCDSEYDTCITSCCDSCGSTLSHNSAGDLICNVGTEANPNGLCIDACLPCSDEYQSCIAYGSYSYPSDSSNDLSGSLGCCGSAFIFFGAFIAYGLYNRKR